MTIRQVLRAVHAALHEQISLPEHLLCDKGKRAEMAAAFRTRTAGAPKEIYDRGILRIDFLGRKTHFLGLVKDGAVVQERLPGGMSAQVTETWVLLVGSRS